METKLNPDQALAILRHGMDMMRLMNNGLTIVGHPRDYELAMVAGAAHIGELEKRPMSISDIHEFTDLPISTVSRKVRLLVASGRFETVPDGNRKRVVWPENKDFEFIRSQLKGQLQIIRRAVDDLLRALEDD